jgi:hypothetical protein
MTHRTIRIFYALMTRCTISYGAAQHKKNLCARPAGKRQFLDTAKFRRQKSVSVKNPSRRRSASAHKIRLC